MRHAIKFLGLIFILSSMLMSCQNELTEQDSISEISSSKKARVAQYRGLSHNGKWFVFKSSKVEDGIYNSLMERMAELDDTGEINDEEFEESNEFIDPSETLAKFESSYRHTSLRSDIEVQRYKMLLQKGADPVRVLNRVGDRGLTQVDQSFVSADGIKQVGKDLFYYDKNGIHYMVANADLETLDVLMHEGYIAALGYTGNVQIINAQPPIVDETCSAEFSITNGANLSVTVVHVGNGQPVIGASYTYIWGDGSPNTTNNTGTASHTYTTPDQYNITLTIDVNEPACQDTYTIINHDVEEDIDWKEEMCDYAQFTAIALASGTLGDPFTGPLAVFQETPGGSPGQVDVSLSPASSLNLAVLSYLANGGSPNDLTWEVDGQAPTTGLTASFTLDCQREATVALTIGVCDPPITMTAIYKEVWPSCRMNTTTGWVGKSYSSQNKASIKLWTKNQKAVVEVRHYKKKNNGSWKKSKADLRVATDDSVATGSAPSQGGCYCSVAESVNINKTRNNKKTLCESYNFVSPYPTGLNVGGTYLPPNYENWSCDLFINNNFLITVDSDMNL